MKRGKLRITNENRVAFWCPGCGYYHELPVNGQERPNWSFNGNYDAPTFSPSVLVRSGHYTGRENVTECWCTYAKEHPEEEVPLKCAVCHSFVTDGKIQYLSDCTHEYAGQTIEMEDIPDDKVDSECD